MPIYRPSELKAFLNSLGVRPNKKLSQNFLIDGNVLDKIVDFALILEDDLVVEIGSGPGALTERLLLCKCEVVAIEKDHVFAEALKRFSSDKLHIYCADACDFPIESVLTRHAKVVANLPYNVTTPLLEKLACMHEHISSCTVMLQQDAAVRFLEERGYFSLFLNYHAKLTRGFNISPSCFYPRPKVGSSVIRLDLEKRQPVSDEEGFFAMLRLAFSQKRKMLASSIKVSLPSRPEDLSLNDWINLWNSL